MFDIQQYDKSKIGLVTVLTDQQNLSNMYTKEYSFLVP